MGLFSITVKQEGDSSYLDGVRLADLNLLYKIYGRTIKYLFNNKVGFWFKRYKIPSTLLFELAYMFYGLYKITRIRRYRASSENLKKQSWLAKALEEGAATDIDVSSILKKKLDISLLPHQEAFIYHYLRNKKHRNLRGGYLAFDQGLGKTATAIALTQVIDAEQTIVVCPNSLKVNWFNEFRKFVKKYHNDVDLVHREIFIQGVTPPEPLTRKKIIISNIESLNKVKSLLPTTTEKALVVDESHILKELSSGRTKLIIKLIKNYNIKDVLLQSGTPIKGIPREILPILVILDKQLNEEGLEIYKKLVRTTSINLMKVFNMKFNFLGYRKTKFDVQGTLKLPPKVRQNIFVKLPDIKEYQIDTVKKAINTFIKQYIKEEKPHVLEYQKIIDKLVLKYKKKTKYLSRNYDKYMKIVKIIRSDAFYNGPDRTLKTIYEKHLLKVMDNPDKKKFRTYAGRANQLHASALGKAIGDVYMARHRQMVTSIATNGVDEFMKVYKQSKAKKIIVMTSYPEAAEKFVETMDKKGLRGVLATGNIDFATRLKNIEAFLQNEDIHFLVGTLQILSVGLTLIESDTVLFLNEPWRWVDKNQAEDRVHRFGQVNTCYSITCLLESDKPTLSSRNNDIILRSKEIFQLIIEGERTKNEVVPVLKKITGLPRK